MRTAKELATAVRLISDYDMVLARQLQTANATTALDGEIPASYYELSTI